ncbi:MAG: cytochrome P450 [Acidimicrobiaceae bacterium]|nr:cytochrome P450 [Acidimicrobiaceae bacterium]
MADTLSIDLTALASFSAGQPWEQYRWLHQHAPVWWHPEAPPGRGFWAVTRYADVQTVSRDPRTYSSWLGGIMLPDSPPELLAGSRLMMLFMDPPDHTRYRRLVSRSFTPRAVQAWRERIDALAARLVDRVAPAGHCDLVEDLAGQMPSVVIAELMGVPGDDGRRLYHLTEIMHSADPVLTDEERMSAVVEMHTYASSVAAEKRAHPADDLATALVHSEVDGERLSDDEFNWFFLLLINAGGDTTRNLVGGGVEALLAWPDELGRWRHDPDGLTATAVEELLRFVSPVVHMRRTATTDAVLGGEAISAGDKVVVFYGAANRDEAVFSHPDTLDLSRSPNPHLAFGAGGPHMCLGAHVARLEAAALLREIVTRLQGLRLDGPIERLDSTFIAGPRHLPVAFDPEI